MFLDHFPESSRIGVSRHPFEDNSRCAIQERTVQNIGVSGDPPDIRRTPIDVILFIIEHIFKSICCVNHVACASVKHSFRFSC